MKAESSEGAYRNAVNFVAVILALLGAIVACASSGTNAAGVFRCQSGGRVVYQDKPCPAGETVRDFEADPPTFSVIPFAMPPPAAPPARVQRNARSPPRERTTSRRGEIARSEAQVAERRHLREGMSDGEVLARLGTPDQKSPGGRGGASWTYLPAPGDAQTVTGVRFDKGRVAGVDRRIVR